MAVVISYLSLQLPLGDVRKVFTLPGPGFFPLILGVLLAILGASFFLKAWVEGTKAKARKEKHPDARAVGSTLRIDRRAFGVLVSVVIYSAVFERLGFLLSTLLFLVILFRAISSQRWTTSIITAVTVSLLSYIIFDIWLMAQLPKGILFR